MRKLCRLACHSNIYRAWRKEELRRGGGFKVITWRGQVTKGVPTFMGGLELSKYHGRSLNTYINYLTFYLSRKREMKALQV